jgi:hypothetical protein
MHHCKRYSHTLGILFRGKNIFKTQGVRESGKKSNSRYSCIQSGMCQSRQSALHRLPYALSVPRSGALLGPGALVQRPVVIKTPVTKTNTTGTRPISKRTDCPESPGISNVRNRNTRTNQRVVDQIVYIRGAGCLSYSQRLCKSLLTRKQ